MFPRCPRYLSKSFTFVCRSWDLVTWFSTVTRVPPHYLCCWDMCCQILDLFPMLWGWNCIIAKVLGLTANLSKDIRLVLQSFSLNTIGNNLHSALEIKMGQNLKRTVWLRWVFESILNKSSNGSYSFEKLLLVFFFLLMKSSFYK